MKHWIYKTEIGTKLNKNIIIKIIPLYNEYFNELNKYWIIKLIAFLIGCGYIY